MTNEAYKPVVRSPSRVLKGSGEKRYNVTIAMDSNLRDMLDAYAKIQGLSLTTAARQLLWKAILPSGPESEAYPPHDPPAS